MQREIKYRAWNIVTKTMIDLKKLTPLALNESMANTDGIFIPFLDDLILMQYTGLKDKNGKECFEFDLVKYADGRPREVAFVNGGFSVHMAESYQSYGMKRLGHTDFEIIGNIYENPELLKQKGK